METLEEFYQHKFHEYPKKNNETIGQFNVFRLENRIDRKEELPVHIRRNFFKIMLFSGTNVFKYGTQHIELSGNTLMFFHPDIPYSYQTLSPDTKGFFCVFKPSFFQGEHKLDLAKIPFFHASNPPFFALSAENFSLVEELFVKMLEEVQGNYIYKYELLKNYVSELFYLSMKWFPQNDIIKPNDAGKRITMIFLELLESQFPIQYKSDKIQIRRPIAFAEEMNIHVNYLNRCIKRITGKTTSQHLYERLAAEAKILLRHTDWTISDISDALGFDDPPHFNKFFKKQTGSSPAAYRLV